MRHDKTKKMLDYWLDLWREAGAMKDARGRVVWPERNAIQPVHCAELLGDMFILDVANGASHYRLAGTRLCATMGRELKDEAFAHAYKDEDQRAAESWATGLVQDDYVVLICSDASIRDGRVIPMETLLMPLNHQGARDQRALGLTVPLEMPNWIASEPIAEIAIRSVRILTPWDDMKNTPSFTNAPSIAPEIAFEAEDHAPLVNADGAVRNAPFLRVLDGGRH